VVGTGYVGLVTGVCLAEKNNVVTCVDVIEEKVDMIKKGKPPIYEKNLQPLLEKNVKNKRLLATTNLGKAMEKTDIIFICVGTPSKEDGAIDLRHVENAVKNIGKNLANLEETDYPVVVVKSTVVPGTTEKIVIPTLEKHSGKKAGKDFGVCMNPEFLREGDAVKDFLNPDRIVIGEHDEKGGDKLDRVYSWSKAPRIRCTPTTAEMIKYASNALLATKISFINEIGNQCKTLGIDVYDVARGVGLDHRISPHFLQAGPGFGGSCFPKDVKALAKQAEELGLQPLLLKAVLEVNRRQPLKAVDLVEKMLGQLEDRTVTILGLTFKPDTDDTRESPAIPIIKKLLERGANVILHDPKAGEKVKKLFYGDKKVEIFEDPQKAVDLGDATILVTAWREYLTLDYSKTRLVDTRHVIDREKCLEYEGICW